jgi:hypothetical protein
MSAMTSIPGPWIAVPDEFDSKGQPWPNGRWKVVGASMVDGTPGCGADVAIHLSEEDAKLIAACKPEVKHVDH